jgi:hypothetical protein
MPYTDPKGALAFSVRGVSATYPCMIGHVGLCLPPLTMDHPSQCVPRYSCHEQRQQRVPGDLLADRPLALADIPLGLWVTFGAV